MIPNPVGQLRGVPINNCEGAIPHHRDYRPMGGAWRGKLVLCYSDNVAVVTQVNSLHASHATASHLLQCLALFQALFDCRIKAAHIPGRENLGADLLSRSRTQVFLRYNPSFSISASQVPPELPCLLRSKPPEGTLHLWRDLFSSFWRVVSPLHPGRCTQLLGTGTKSS